MTRSTRALGLIASLALATPVLVSTAGAESAEGGVCQDPALAAQAREEAADARERAEDRTQTRGAHAGDPVVVLNGRGYNYGPQSHAPDASIAPGVSPPASRD